MKKFDITQLAERYDNVLASANGSEKDIAVMFLVTNDKGDAGTITYFTKQPNEIRIFIDNFPGRKKDFTTNIPFETFEEFEDKIRLLGLELVSNSKKTSTNSKIGSAHWFNTLISRNLHFGEFITKNADNPEILTNDRIKKMGADLYDSSKELIRGFEFINRND